MYSVLKMLGGTCLMLPIPLNLQYWSYCLQEEQTYTPHLIALDLLITIHSSSTGGADLYPSPYSTGFTRQLEDIEARRHAL